MTDRVEITQDDVADARQLASSVYRGGSNWVVPGTDDPGNIATDNSDIDATALDGFTQSSGSGSLDVTINPGQGYVGGTWLARDVSTTVTLDASTDGQEVFVGPDVDSNNAVIIGKSGAFDADDPKTKLHEFDTDSNGVTAVRDRRTLSETDNHDAIVFGGY